MDVSYFSPVFSSGSLQPTFSLSIVDVYIILAELPSSLWRICRIVGRVSTQFRFLSWKEASHMRRIKSNLVYSCPHIVHYSLCPTKHYNRTSSWLEQNHGYAMEVKYENHFSLTHGNKRIFSMSWYILAKVAKFLHEEISRS